MPQTAEICGHASETYFTPNAKWEKWKKRFKYTNILWSFSESPTQIPGRLGRPPWTSA